MKHFKLLKAADISFYKKFKRQWKNYVFQISIATLSIFITILFIKMQNAVMVASLGATTFIVFITPTNFIANGRNVIGGHIIGTSVGMLFTLIPVSPPITPTIIFSLTVGTSMFLMAITDMEHPPACATALGIVSAGYTFSMIFAFITGVIILSSLHHILKPKLKDLV